MMMAMIAIDWGTLASKSVVDGFIMSGNINHYKDHNINKNNNYHTKRTYQNYLHHNPTSFTYTSRIKSLQPIRSPQFSQSSSSSSSSSLFLATNTNNNEFNNNNNNMEDDSSSSSTIKKNNNNVETSRREVFEKAAGIALALTILDTTTSTMTNNVKAASAITTTLTADNEMISATSPSSNKATSQPRIIVMTGANSGIGYEACKRIMKQQQEGDDTQPKTTIVLACRTYEKAKDTMERLLNENNNNNNNIQFIPAECNLASLKSIQQFAKTYFTKPTTEDTSYPSHIDVLALNAGIARNINSEECIRTDDGYELTIGTNHFGHFYLTYLLLPFLQQKDKSNMNQKKIVITASSVHDPDSPGGSQGEKATLGTLNGLIKQGVNCEMIDGNPFNADKAYKDSKVCIRFLCVLFRVNIFQYKLNDCIMKVVCVLYPSHSAQFTLLSWIYVFVFFCFFCGL